MPVWLLYSAFSLFFVLASTAIFFFVVTRGTLLMRGFFGTTPSHSALIYPIYSNLLLMRLVDFQPIISAILLFQYDRLVRAITNELRQMDLQDKDVLITSCPFGNMIARVAQASLESGARRVLIADLIKNELAHAQGKLIDFPGQIAYLHEDATAMKQPDGSVAANVLFFLLHELPHTLKSAAIQEATRVLTPGGKLYIAEFHRPDSRLLRTLSWTYFKVFEPWALALWKTHDPLLALEAMDGLTCQRRTFFFGNFQIIVATKNTKPST